MELLKRLTKCNSPSGNEKEIYDIISNEISQYVDEIQTDALGNLIAHKNGNGKKVMFSAHMDEIGIIATFIDDNGFIRFSNIGGLNVKNMVNTKVQFSNGIVGVIGSEEEEFSKKPSLNKLFIDVGASSKTEAEKCVCIGDTAMFVGDLYVSNNKVISKALDNRIGCYTLIEAIKRVKEAQNDLYFVFTVQEEVGIRGAKTSAYGIDPDFAIAVDVTDTGDTPNALAMAVKFGGGTAVKVMDRSIICDSSVRCTLIELCKNNNIPYQLEIMTDGGTDAGGIHISRAGVKTGGISIPTRYIHSPSEMADLDDVKACIDLVEASAVHKW